MATTAAEQERLDSWEIEWNESDERKEELLERFEAKLAEVDEDIVEELNAAGTGADDGSDRSWMRDPNGDQALAIFDAVQEAGAADDITFTDRAVLRESVIDKLTADASRTVEQDGNQDVKDLLTNGRRTMDRGMAMGSAETFARGLSDARTAQRRSETDDSQTSESAGATERANEFAERWSELATAGTVATELSVSDDRLLNHSLRQMKDLYEQTSYGLATQEQYQMAGNVAAQFVAETEATANAIASGEISAGDAGPGDQERAAAHRIAAGVVAANLADAREDITEALVHVDRRWIHDAGHAAAWAIEDLRDIQNGRQLSTAAFEGNSEADRLYSQLWDQSRRAA